MEVKLLIGAAIVFAGCLLGNQWKSEDKKMKVAIDIDEKTLNKLSRSVDSPPLYDKETEEVDEYELSYAIQLFVELCGLD